jgi:hypothetical protein
MLSLIAALLITTSTVSATPVVYIGQSRLAPDSPLYFIKTIQEDIESRFASTETSKTFRQVEFSTRRLREVATLISDGRQDLIPPVLENYKVSVGTALKLADKKSFEGEVGEEYGRHLSVLERQYASTSDPRAKRSIRAAVEIILVKNIVPASSKLEACKFLQKEASSSAITETEKEFIGTRVALCKSTPV